MKNKSKVQNPLTIIAIFAGIAEIAGTTVLLGLPLEIQRVFVWFVMLFPCVLVLFFFLILIFNNGVLYAPSDFTDESHFIGILENKRSRINTELTELKNGIEEAKKQLEEPTTVDTLPLRIKELSEKLDLLQSKVESAKQTNNDLEIKRDARLKQKNFVREVSKMNDLSIKLLEELSRAECSGRTMTELFKKTGVEEHLVIMEIARLKHRGYVMQREDKFYLETSCI
ncbi:coiled-coil domain-containing protein [Paenibacillus alvei]|uniref:coiled-coil domain-containing protein n=1 Tax=Paenibacillus alvei TaxID=44250 RepID=UPI0013DD47F5|nr:hypothetical protein [Paenibacillus alvei]NEZ45330.1 hypothetical protein [Paenibacillus alvei]